MIGAIFSIAFKDIRLLARDRAGLFFTFVFPILIGVFFGTIFAGPGADGPSAVTVAVVDEDRSPESTAFIADLGASTEPGKPAPFAVTPAPTREEAVSLVRRGKCTGVVVLPKGFGSSSGGTGLFAGTPVTIETGTDPSRSAEAGMIRGMLTERAFRQFSSGFADPEKMRKNAAAARLQVKAMQFFNPSASPAVDTFYDKLDATLEAAGKLPDREPEGLPAAPQAVQAKAGGGFNPVNIRTIEIQPVEKFGPKNAFAVTFAQAVMWGVVGCCSGFAVSLLNERVSGTLVRLRLSPLGWPRVLAGKALSCFMTTMSVGVLMIAVAVVVFAVRPVSWAWLTVALICVSVCFVGIMMLLAVIARRTGSGQIGWSILLVLTMAGGGSIPLFVMPGWLQQASGISPVKWGILAIEGGLWRGSGFADMVLPCGILVGVGVLSFVVGSRGFSRDEAA